MKIIEIIKKINYEDTFVNKHKAEDEHRIQRGISIIAAAAFIVMSFLNIKQGSTFMLLTTSLSALFLIIGYLLSKYKNKTLFLRMVYYFIFVIIFTNYTIQGGNDGFAVLWIVVATYAVMIGINFKAGFIISFYYFIMLLLVFIGPLSFVLEYEYNTTFMLRFPFLYAINFAFATYITIRIRKYQYEILIKQQELEKISNTDLSTGVQNRNGFIQYEKCLKFKQLKSLTAIFIDVNGLHEINNKYGHDAGDRMLKSIASECKAAFNQDEVYRMGGDEFIILCENSNIDETKKGMETLLSSIHQLGYSISYGIERRQENFDIDEIVKKADAAMIEFKKEYYKTLQKEGR